MKRTVRLIALMLVAVMLLSTMLTSCEWLDGILGKTTTTTQKPECNHADADGNGLCDKCGQILEIQNTDSSFSYYANTKLPEDKKIYVLNMTSEGYNFTEDELFTAQAIQGLFARKSALFYLDSHYMTNGVNIDMHYLDLAVENYGITYESITLDEAVAMYIANWEQTLLTAHGVLKSILQAITASPALLLILKRVERDTAHPVISYIRRVTFP